MARYYGWNHHHPMTTTVGLLIILVVILCGGPLTTTTVQAQFASCTNARAIASEISIQHHTCPTTDAVCTAGIVCQDCVGGGDGFAAGCFDGCAYTVLDGYTVEVYGAGTAGVGYLLGSQVPIIIQSYKYTFSSTSVSPGTTMTNQYEATTTTTGGIRPVLGKSCDFTFNGNTCACEQRYCDASKAIFGFYIDCSAFPGGSVVNECSVPDALTADLPLLTILFYTPMMPRPCPDSPISSNSAASPIAAPVPASRPATAVTAAGPAATSPVVGGAVVPTVAATSTNTTSTTTNPFSGAAGASLAVHSNWVGLIIMATGVVAMVVL